MILKLWEHLTSANLVSWVHQKYMIKVIAVHCEQCSGQPWILNNSHVWHLAGIVCSNRQSAHPMQEVANAHPAALFSSDEI